MSESFNLKELRARWRQLRDRLQEHYSECARLRQRVRELEHEVWMLAMGKQLSTEERRRLLQEINSYISSIRKLRKMIHHELFSRQ